MHIYEGWIAWDIMVIDTTGNFGIVMKFKWSRNFSLLRNKQKNKLSWTIYWTESLKEMEEILEERK